MSRFTSSLKTLLLAGIMLAFFYSQAKSECLDVYDMAKKIMTERHQAYVATMIDSRGFVIQLYINLKSGDWTIVDVSDDLKACVLLSGIEFSPAVSEES